MQGAPRQSFCASQPRTTDYLCTREPARVTVRKLTTNVNFGSTSRLVQFGEQVSRTFEVRNEGLFDFKYTICDYANEEEKL